MSENKRQRMVPNIGLPVQKETQEAVLEKPKAKEKNWFSDNGEFDWEGYEATCITKQRKPNPHIKTKGKDRVYSRESYAQELYNLYTDHPSVQNIKATATPGELVEGKIYGITSEWITVDANFRELIYIKTSKEPVSIVEDYKPGDDVSVLITSEIGAKMDGNITGSISGGIKHKTFGDLISGIETGNTAWIGNVSHMIQNGGYIVEVQGIECFMPGSLAGINKLNDFESIIGTELYVVPVSHSQERGTIVVSHRKYLKALIPSEIENLKAVVDEKITGTVTGTAKFGIFCEFNDCLTGMIHANDIDEDTMVKFKSREIKPGDSIEFWVKDIVTNSKITLSQKAENINNPWKDIDKRYKIPCNVEAIVKTKKEYGLFISIEEGLVGLLHVSEFPEGIIDTFNPGDKIVVQVNRIDKESQKIFLKFPL